MRVCATLFIFIMKLRFRLTILALFILAGGLLFHQQILRAFHKQEPVTTTFTQSVQRTPAVASAQTASIRIEGKPTRLQIPALTLDLPVADGIYYKQSKTWSLSNNKAHYALITPLANNEDGNTFIYGHNRREVFKNLNKIKTGDKAVITTDNGHTFTYIFRSSLETNPYDDSLFSYKGSPILTIQTCSGLWYQNRQLFTFDLAEVQ